MARTITGLAGPKLLSCIECNPKTPKNQFERLVISASGPIPDHRHAEIQAMVEECGAKFEKMKISDCTHLITTAECYHREAAPAKISEARQNHNCDIVSIDWLLASIKQKEPLNTRGFLIRALGSKRLVPTTSNATSSPTSTRKRKPSSDLNDGEGRRAKIAKDRVLANRDKLSSLVDKASHAKDERKKLLVWIDEGDVIWDATLVEKLSALDNPTNLETTSAKIIRIQLLLDVKGDKYDTCIRETTMTRQQLSSSQKPTSVRSIFTRKGDGHLPRAITEFETAFERLTGLAWSERLEQPKEAKAIFIKLESKNDPGQLDSAVSDVLGKFVKLEKLSDAKCTLLEPYPNQLLEKEEKSVDHSLHTSIALLDKLSEVQSCGSASARSLTTSLSQCFFGLFWPAGTPLPTKSEWISRSRGSIEDLRHCRALEDAQKNLRQPVPSIMRHVLGLLHLEAMTRVKMGTVAHKALAEYFKKSSGWHSVTILNIFQLERQGEAEQFSQWRDNHKSFLSQRRLLWHGSAVSSFASILRHGFRIGPSAGIFFADWVEKSLDFCRVTGGQEAFMLLCEVEFGREGGNWNGSKGNANSYIYDGLSHKTWCDAVSVHPNLKGVKIPKVCLEGKVGYQFTKEYVIMDPAQIRQRYMFHFRLN